MHKHFIPSLLLLTIFVAFAQAGPPRFNEPNGFRAALAAIEPRLMHWNRRQDNPQQPIIILQPNQDSDRNRRPYWGDYPYVPPNRFPNNQIPGFSDYFSGPGGSVIIINPNNAQGISLIPGAGGAANNGSRSFSLRREAIPFFEILQALNAQEYESEANDADAAAALAAATAPAQAPVVDYGTVEEQHDEEPNEDEYGLVERQAARGVSPKQLLSYLMQEKKRRRVQESVAGIYFKNYNQNRK